MKTVTNNAKRRLGLPGRPALLLNPGESKTIEDSQVAEIETSNIAKGWIRSGLVSISDGAETEEKSEDPKSDQDLPEGLTGKGFEIFNEGSGWYSAWVNGFKVTDSKVRKKAAEALRKEYD